MTKGFFKNIFYHLTKSNKRGYVWTIIILSICLLLSLTFCVGEDSIQNYVGSEIISTRTYQDGNKQTYQYLQIRTKIKDAETGKNYYKIIPIKCYDAQGYQAGDTIKFNKFTK